MTLKKFFFYDLADILLMINLATMTVAFFYYLFFKSGKHENRGSVLLTLGLTTVSYSLSFTGLDWHVTPFIMNPYILYMIYDLELILLLWALHTLLRLRYSVAFFYLLVFSIANNIQFAVMYVDQVIYGQKEAWWLWYVYAGLGKVFAICLNVGICTNIDFLKLRVLKEKLFSLFARS